MGFVIAGTIYASFYKVDGLTDFENQALSKNPVVDLSHLKGLTKDEMLFRFGDPDSEHRFLLSRGKKLPEFESELYELLKTKKEENIIRLMWSFDTIKRVVWLVKRGEEWRAYNGMTWDSSRIDM